MPAAIGVRFTTTETRTITVTIELNEFGEGVTAPLSLTGSGGWYELNTLVDADGGVVGVGPLDETDVSKLVTSNWTIWFEVPGGLTDITDTECVVQAGSWDDSMTAQWLYRDHDEVVTEIPHDTTGMIDEWTFGIAAFFQYRTISPAFDLSAGEPVDERWTNKIKTIEVLP